MSIAMLFSMFLHECGHASVFAITRIRYIILYLFPLGAVAAPIDESENKRSDQLPWNSIAWLLQAGPGVNVALMVIFLGLQPIFAEQLLPSAEINAILGQFARDMVYVNGLLAAMNLVPVWTLDAGQLFRVIYNSLDEREDSVLTGVALAFVGIIVLIILGLPGVITWSMILFNTLTRFGWIAFLLIFAVGILNKQGRDDPLNAQSHQAMDNRQVLIHLIVYTLMVGINLWIAAGPIL